MESNIFPIVSIIIPAYNAQDYIKETIDSVLNQTIQDFECLIIDDCSKDDTYKIIEEYSKKDSRIKGFRNECNSGVSKTRNRGLELCKGKYVALLDSDDVWYKDKLEKQIECIEKYNADLIYCSYDLIDENGNHKKQFIVNENTSFKDILVLSPISCSTALFTNKIAKNYSFKTNFYHEDYVFWLDILKDGNVSKGIVDSLAAYRVMEGTRSSNKLNAAKKRWDIYRKYLKFSLVKSLYWFSKYAIAGFIKYKK